MQLKGYQVVLEPVQKQDLEMLRNWRNSPAIRQQMLSQALITAEQQQAWFNKIQLDSSQQHFVIFYKQKPIGSANIKAKYRNASLLQSDIVEAGLFIADEQYRNNILAFAPTLLLNDYCFEQLGVEKLIAVVKASNQPALNYNKKIGYKIEKQGDLVEISLSKADYEQSTVALKALLSR